MKLHGTESGDFDISELIAGKEEHLIRSGLSIREGNELTEQELDFITKNTNRSVNLQEHDSSHFTGISENGFVIISSSKGIVGHIMAHDYSFKGQKVLERGSLWIDPILRKQGIGQYLMCKLNEQIDDKPVVSVTRVPPVIKVNNLIMPFRVDNPQGDFRSMLEEGGPLTDEYQYYINSTLKNLLEGNFS